MCWRLLLICMNFDLFCFNFFLSSSNLCCVCLFSVICLSVSSIAAFREKKSFRRQTTRLNWFSHLHRLIKYAHRNILPLCKLHICNRSKLGKQNHTNHRCERKEKHKIRSISWKKILSIGLSLDMWNVSPNELFQWWIKRFGSLWICYQFFFLALHKWASERMRVPAERARNEREKSKCHKQSSQIHIQQVWWRLQLLTRCLPLTLFITVALAMYVIEWKTLRLLFYFDSLRVLVLTLFPSVLIFTHRFCFFSLFFFQCHLVCYFVSAIKYFSLLLQMHLKGIHCWLPRGNIPDDRYWVHKRNEIKSDKPIHLMVCIAHQNSNDGMAYTYSTAA